MTLSVTALAYKSDTIVAVNCLAAQPGRSRPSQVWRLPDN
jgi:hypothetical protein